MDEGPFPDTIAATRPSSVIVGYHDGDTLHAFACRRDRAWNLIRIWVHKADAGALDEDSAAAEPLTAYEDRIAVLDLPVRPLGTKDREIKRGHALRTLAAKRAYIRDGRPAASPSGGDAS